MLNKIGQGFLVFCSLATLSNMAHAFPGYFRDFQDHYSSIGISTVNLTNLERCGVCHVSSRGGGLRNPFGKSFQDIALARPLAFSSLDNIDSDRDGFTNIEEIYVNTAPGRKESSPFGRISITDTGSALKLSSPSECQTLEIKSYGPLVNGLESITYQNFNGLLEVSLSSDQGLIIARCDYEKLTGSWQK